MATYVNPGNAAFAEVLEGKYIDKTNLIGLLNSRIGKPNKLVCVSRARRFGKTFASKMLTAYYDCSCDSQNLFEDKYIAQSEDYQKHLNQYHVIALDVSGFTSEAGQDGHSLREVPAMIKKAIQKDLIKMRFESDEKEPLTDILLRFVEKDGRKIIFVIDEWDAVIREAKDDPVAQKQYLDLLRSWFKNTSFTPKVVAAAYMTGILPIKKDGSQSAISDFKEFTMIKPRKFGEFVGFTENEVLDLCEENEIDFQSMKQWYDGYTFQDVGSIYNPSSVMEAIDNGDFDSYWSETAAADGLLDYLTKPYNGLAKTIAELIGGIDVKVNPTGFANDLTTFRGKDDVLTLLIHFGYLAYDSVKKTARIPNEEIKLEFQKAVHETDHAETLKRLEESERLFRDTIDENEDAVALQIEKIHREETAPIHYNKEDSLRSVIKLAYYTYREHYIQLEELPSGEGYADVVYLPKPDSDWPTLMIELKWKKSAKGAIDQILEKKYPDVLKDFGRDILLVGINYDKDAPDGSKKHSCKIVKFMND